MTNEPKLEQNSEIPIILKDTPKEKTSDKRAIIISILISLVVITLVVLATIFLVNPANQETTAQVRDIFIIFMALEAVLIGVALVILIIQLSALINLLQNEIRPIINSTSETVNTLKGTATFMSNNLSEPVIKANQFIAMIKTLFKPSNK
jgi:flagellar basal body-associated protein FliL